MFNRPSCYCCPSKNGRSQSDITIGDYWGLPDRLKSWDDDKGISVVLVFSKKGKMILDEVGMEQVPTTLEEGIRYNPNYAYSCVKTKTTDLFWKLYPERGIDAIEICVKKMEPSILYRAMRKVYRLIKKIFEKNESWNNNISCIA